MTPILERLKELPTQFEPAVQLLFSSNDQTLFLAKRSGDINTFTITDDSEIVYQDTIHTQKGNHINCSCKKIK